MADRLPKFVAIRSVFSGRYACYMTETEALRGAVFCLEENVFNPLVKVEVERAQIDSKFVHLRFCHTNRYWARVGPTINDLWVHATSNQPEEDISKWSCTLFEPTFPNPNNGTIINFVHVQSRRPIGAISHGDAAGRVYVHESFGGNGTFDMTFVDWDTLVVMPKHVTFKGYNDKYLRARWIEGHEYHQFSSDDGNEEATAYEVTMHRDGHLRIKSNFFGKFWRRSPNWIWADSTDIVGNNNSDTLFWPVRVHDNIIALRNAGNNRFCSSLTADRKTDCLNAAVNTITSEARLIVEELVFEREIFDVVYHMDDARIFDEQAAVAGTGNGVNDSSHEATLAIRVSFEETTSFTFSNSLSITTGVSTTIRTGFARIVDGEIQVSAEVSTSVEWNRTTEETRTAEASYTAVVPPRSRARVNYVATRGTCNIPFSYTQRDRRSTDGSFIVNRHSDGVYTGVNYYSFHFEQLQFEPL